jgi:beta-lactamase class C
MKSFWNKYKISCCLANPCWLIVHLIIACIAPHSKAGDEGLPSALFQDFEQFAERAMQKYAVPGAAIAIVTPQQILLLKTYGIKQLGKPEPIDQDTVFRIASLSKLLTSALVVKLAAKESIDLNAFITQYLPSIKVGEPNFAHNIKVRHLLSHTTGALAYCLEHEAYRQQDFSRLVKNLRLAKKVSEPGIRFQYQNVLFSLIDPIIGETTGLDFLANLRQEILYPLEITEDFSSDQDYKLHHNVAQPHIGKKFFCYRPYTGTSYYDNILPAGGMAFSIQDMAKILQALLGGYSEVLTQDMLTTLYTPVTSLRKVGMLCKKGRCRRCHKKAQKCSSLQQYGLGCRIRDYAGQSIIYHCGTLNGFTAQFNLSIEHNIGIVVLTNADASPFPNKVTRHFFNVLFKNLPAEGSPDI